MDSKRRDRVAKACAHCRRKKIKCDGESPCNHCQNLKLKCVYESNKVRKPRNNTNEAFGNRLRRLEDMMQTLISKIDHLNLVPNGSKLNGIPSSTLNETIKLEDLGMSKDSGDLATDCSDDSDATNLPDQDPNAEGLQSMFQQFKAMCDEPMDKSTDVGSVSNHYRGSHLGFNLIFSELTINHVKLILKPSSHDILTPLETMPVYMLAWKKLFQNIWSEPRPTSAEYIQKLRNGDIPDEDLVEEMLSIYNNINICWGICGQEPVRKLFQIYFSNKTAKKHEFKHLSYSQLMVMSLVVAITVSAYVEHLKIPVDEKMTPILASMSISELVALQERMFSNTLFYYHRISTISEGFVSIQAILLMVLYLEMTWVYTDVNFNLCSIAVRYAQDLGLHRVETYQHLSPEEYRQRLLLWAAVQFFDNEMCYRMGKPALTNVFDRPDSSDFDFKAADMQCGHTLMHGAYSKLTDLRLHTYFTLFSAHVNYTSVKKIQETVISLNNKLEEIRDMVEPAVRPRFFFEADFEKALRHVSLDPEAIHQKDFIVNFHLTYFSHLMIINRVPWNMVNGEVDSPPQENSKFRCISLDSARTIMHIVRTFDQDKSPFFCLNWFVTYPFLAAMNLLSNVVNHPLDADTLRDIDLLIDVSMNFFGAIGSQFEAQATRLYYLRFHMFDMVLRVTLLIAIALVEQSANLTILANNPALIKHFNYVKKKYPHYYKRIPNKTVIKECLTHVYVRTGLFGNPTSKIENYTSLSSNPTHMHSNLSYESVLSEFATDSNYTIPQEPFGNGIDMKSFQVWDPIEIDFVDATLQEYQSLPNFFFDNGI